MSYHGDMMIEYEEQNWQELAEKFIMKHEELWIDFVCDMYNQHIADMEPLDYEPEPKD